MNEEIRPTSLATEGHPDEDQLLLALERELPADMAGQVEQHLGNCWSCRARFDEMQRGILAFVEYREKRYLPSLASPPDDSSGFRDRLRSVLSERDPISLPTRIWRRLLALFAIPHPIKWASAVALIMAGVVFWVHIVDPPALSAAELLTRAIAAQNPSPSGEKTTRRRIARQKVRIQRGQQAVVRDFEWTIGNRAKAMRWEVDSDPSAWTAPMTADGFANWRSLLQQKHDDVRHADGRLTLDTATDQGPITEAWIVVRASDFHPVEQHLRFTDKQQLDFTELAFQIVDEPQRTHDSRHQVADPSKLSSTPAPPPQADLDEVELRLRYTLFTHSWDLGEDLSIGRTADLVTLSGTVSSGERASEMQAVLSTLPDVRISLDQPHASVAQSAEPTVAKSASLSSTPLLKDLLENRFPSRDDRLAFVDQCLADSDKALSRAWALKKLVDRYSETEERLFKPEPDSRLIEMLRTHLQQLSLANQGLEPLLEYLPASNVPAPGAGSTWRARILSLFTAVQQQDRLVAALLVGSQTNVPNLMTASVDLRSAHESISSLIRSLKDLAGDSPVK